jgi:hypothetical protein
MDFDESCTEISLFTNGGETHIVPSQSADSFSL